MAELIQEVRELIKKGTPMDALTLMKEKSPENVKKVIENLFEDLGAAKELDDEWKDPILLSYYAYFSYITSGILDSQSLTECTVSSLNAVNIAKKLKFPELEATFLFNAGQALDNMEMNEKAVRCYKDAAKIYETLGDEYLGRLAATLNNVGTLLIELKKIEASKDYLIRALEIRRGLAEKDEKYVSELAETLNNAGSLYGDMRDYKKSEECYNESISLFRKLSEENVFQKANLAATLNNFSIVLRRLRRYDDAEKNTQEALDIFKELKEVNKGFEGLYAETLNSLGVIYNEMGEHKKAEELFAEYNNLLEKFNAEQLKLKDAKKE